MTITTQARPLRAQIISWLISHRRAALAMALVGGGGMLLLLGSLLPWVAGPDADHVTYGTVELNSGRTALGSRAGLAGGDAVVTIIASAMALLVATRAAFGRWPSWQRHAAACSGLLAGAWTALDMAEVGETLGSRGEQLDLTAGMGTYVVLAGALAVVAGAYLAPRSWVQDLDTAVWRSVKLERMGRLGESTELAQHVVRYAYRRADAQDSSLAFAVVDLALLYHDLGLPDRAAAAVRLALSDQVIRFKNDPQELQLLHEAIHPLAVAYGWQSRR